MIGQTVSHYRYAGIHVVPSPDGRYLAVSGQSQYASNWMLENS